MRGIKTIYNGKSGFSGYWRGPAHLEGLTKKDLDNVLFTHNLKAHPTIDMGRKDFVMTVEETFARPVLRQVYEGCVITRSLYLRAIGANIELLNSKKKFNQPGTIRPQMTKLFSQGSESCSIQQNFIQILRGVPFQDIHQCNQGRQPSNRLKQLTKLIQLFKRL